MKKFMMATLALASLGAFAAETTTVMMDFTCELKGKKVSQADGSASGGTLMLKDDEVTGTPVCFTFTEYKDTCMTLSRHRKLNNIAHTVYYAEDVRIGGALDDTISFTNIRISEGAKSINLINSKKALRRDARLECEYTNVRY